MRHQGLAVLVVVAMLAPALTGWMAQEASADATTVPGTLPSARSQYASAIWDGTHAYVFGGRLSGGDRTDQLVRYDPATGTSTLASATLPSANYAHSAVWDGTHAYIFGGCSDDACRTSEIVQYDPSTDTTTVMDATLPTGISWTSAVWDGTHAYIFGGYDGASRDEILRYHPGTDTVTTASTTLPTGRHFTSAVWDGTNAYIFGGYDGSSLLDEIIRYDPATDTIAVMDATLPTPRSVTSAVWDGTHAYIFGGWSPIDDIVRYDPATDTTTVMSATLPSPRGFTSAVWTGAHAYVFGGEDSSQYFDEVVRYDLSPGAPTSLTAAAGPGAGEITLAWEPPARNTYTSALTGYKIYRGPTALSLTLHASVDASTTTFLDTGLGEWETWYYAVSAENAAGEGAVSAVAHATTAVPAAAWAWGHSTHGQVGDGTTTTRTRPVQVAGPGGTGALQDVVQVAGGSAHSVATRSDGTAWAWGYNGNGRLGDGTATQTTTPVQVVGPGGVGSLLNVIEVSAGASHSLALRADGTVWAWGWNMFGQLGDGTTAESRTPVQVVGPGGTGFLTDVVHVSAGSIHNIAVKGDGTVWAWGYNGGGRLGDGTTTNHGTPVQVVGHGGVGFLTEVVHASAGGGHNVVVRADGTVCAWGYNRSGQVGDGTTTDRHTPVQVLGPGGVGLLTNVTRASAGHGSQTIAVKEDGTAWAWGLNEWGQLGDGTTTKRLTPVQVVDSGGAGFLTDVVDASTGLSHSVAVKRDGTVWAWGRNTHGDLGDGTTVHSSTPVQVVGPGNEAFLTDVTAAFASTNHNLVVQNDGTAWAWGNHANGQLGDGTPTQRTSPVQALGAAGEGVLTDVVHLSAGGAHTLAVTADGTAWAWGSNEEGQLGDATPFQRLTPVPVVGPGGAGSLTDVVQVAAGIAHTLAVKADGTVWAWGSNDWSQLGDGTTTQRTTPVQVLGPDGVGYLTDVVEVSAGMLHSVAVKADGTVWAWGSNAWGQLGDGTTTQRATPVQVVGPDGVGVLTGVVHVSAGSVHNLALKQDGTVWAWGLNGQGRLGDGTRTTRTTPVQVVGPGGSGFLTDVTQASAGGSHNLAVKVDGTVWAWGYNEHGRLGDGTTTQRWTPVQVLGPDGGGFLTDVAEVSAGGSHSLAVKIDGTVWAWGNNIHGRLADGTTFQRRTPVQVVGPEVEGNLTSVVRVSAGGSHSIALRNVVLPGPPRDLAATAGPSAGEITLSWLPPVDTGGGPTTGHRIYRGSSSDSLELFGETGPDTTFVDASCPLGETCYYQVTAVNLAGEGPPSNEASAAGTRPTDTYKQCTEKTLTGWLCTPGSPNPVTALSAAATHTCVRLVTGNVDCWGDNADGKASDHTTGGALAVSTGRTHTCALLATGDTACWGDNAWGKAAAYTGGDAIAVAAGGTHTCLLLEDGNAACQGSDFHGQATGYTGGDATAVTAGQQHTCLLLTNGNVHCFGDNDHGQAAGYTGGDAVAVSAGQGHTCILLSDGDVTCQGRNDDAQASGYTGGDALAVSAGHAHTCVLTSAGNVDCFGSDRYGQAAGYAGGDAVAVSAGRYHTSVLLSDGSVVAFGTPPEHEDFGQAEGYP